MCGCRDLGEALRRIGEGAAMIRTKGEAGTGNIVEAVRHLRALRARDPPARATLGDEELMRRGQDARRAARAGARRSRATGRLPVPNFAAGGIATPADAALCMALGAEAVFVGSGIFLVRGSGRAARAPSSTPSRTGRTPSKLAEISDRPRRGDARHRARHASPTASGSPTRGW